MSEDSYTVGYGKPPRHSQFKPGQSGNPTGKRKGVRSLKADLAQELGEEVRVSGNGKVRHLSMQQLLVKTFVTKAVKGDTRLISKFFDVATLFFGIAPDEEASAAPLSAEDAAVLAAAVARATRNRTEGEDGGG